VLAASVLVAFGLGVLSASMLRGPALKSAPIASGRNGDSDKPIVEPTIAAGKEDTQKLRPATQRPVLAAFAARAGAVETTVQIPVVSVDDAREAVAPPPVVPDYVRQQWERRGFDVQTQRRYLFAVLPNGERAVVPVDNVKFRPIPINVY
jgi:hypothetical protein